jgi:predicted permease
VWPEAKYAEPARHRQLLDDLVAQLEAGPGIDAATPISTPPFAGTDGWDAPKFTAENQGRERAERNPALNIEAIHPNYFATLDVRIVRGRAFTDTDRAAAPAVAIVSEDVAAATWPGGDAIGKRLKLGGSDSRDPWRTVVGVVKPTRYRELAEARPTLYLPAHQFILSARTLMLRTDLPLAVVAGLARERIRAVDPELRVMAVVPFADLLDGPLARPRFNAFLIGMFGGAALLLAGIGVYAVMAAYVRQRHAEIGIRIALGATAGDVRGLVLAEGLRLTALGAVIGLAIAVAAARVVRGLLFAVHPLDPASLLGAALLLVGASALACYLPARRAARVDPIALLRTT